VRSSSLADFAEYAEVCFRHFGDRVRHWLTINEPMTVALNGYSSGEHAPGRCSNRTFCAAGDSSTEPYLVAHNLLNAHAAAVEVYRQRFQATQRGEISLAVNSDFAYPFDAASPADQAAAQR
jgi:beta-glucosidase